MRHVLLLLSSLRVHIGIVGGLCRARVHTGILGVRVLKGWWGGGSGCWDVRVILKFPFASDQ